jgi:hypothetical protein
MQFHKGAHDRKTKTNAAMSRASGMRLETIEDSLQNIWRNPPTTIGDFENNFIFTPEGGKRYRLAWTGKANCIG